GHQPAPADLVLDPAVTARLAGLRAPPPGTGTAGFQALDVGMVIQHTEAVLAAVPVRGQIHVEKGTLLILVHPGPGLDPDRQAIDHVLTVHALDPHAMIAVHPQRTVHIAR